MTEFLKRLMWDNKIMQLALIPAFPALASLLLLFFGKRFSERMNSFLGVLGIFSSFICAAGAIFFIVSGHQDFQAYREILWTWIPFYSSESDTGTLQMAFYLDSLSAVMLMVVTFISSLIALFSVAFMQGDPELDWFFACMNWFVAMMLVLVLADNFLVLFLGWEGVGLTSYLLIGFWRQEIENGKAATKAFIITRIGDVCLLFGIFLLFSEFGTLNIQEILDLADANWTVGSWIPMLVALCLLGGAVGKSAQLPLHAWLADAMRGPTPVSALIHAATMVTAGVYLIARTGILFSLSPIVQLMVMWIGAATLIYAGIMALLQNNYKRVLAYSTMSQLGYMFLALGAGAYSAAIFHLATHACFKALLFLGAGVVGYLFHHEYSLERIGNLRYQVPILFWVFLIGLSSLSALPFVTSGFYSKELILSQVFLSQTGGLWPWCIGVFGALLTGAYSCRLFVLLFFKKAENPVSKQSHEVGWCMNVPLFILAVLALGVGFLPIPIWAQSAVLEPILNQEQTSWKLELIASSLAMLGIGFGFLGKIVKLNWDLDAYYVALFSKPYAQISFFFRADPIRAVYHLMVVAGHGVWRTASWMQTGNPSHYLSMFIVALILFLGFVVSL